MTQIAQFLGGVALGEPVSFGGLTLFPLRSAQPRDADYDILPVAITTGTARVTEVSQGGSVPELLIETKGGRPVLAIDGEELIGAKQNRVVNVSILLAAQAQTRIPVSCTEAGRWRHESPEFMASPQAMYPEARARKVRDVSATLKSQRSYRGDQGAVWHSIDSKLGAMGQAAPTRAMSELYAGRSGTIEEFVRAFAPVEGQVGAVYAIGGRVVGLDGFDAPSTWRAYAPRLVRGYALDALSTVAPAPVPRDAAAAWLADLGLDPVESYPGVGLGETLRFTGARVHGSALWAEGRVMHLVAFAARNN